MIKGPSTRAKEFAFKFLIPFLIILGIFYFFWYVAAPIRNSIGFFLYGNDYNSSAHRADSIQTWVFIILFSAALPLAYWKLPFFKNALHSVLNRPKVFIFQDVVVTYRIADSGPVFPNHQSELTRILTANRNVDLHEYEEALGITIINVQRQSAAPAVERKHPPDIRI